MEDPWGRAVAAAGAVGAFVALLYVIGGAALSIRYQGFELPGNVAAVQTPREVLLAAGLRTLGIWALVGVVLVLALRRLPEDRGRAMADWLRTRAGIFAAVAVALAFMLVLRVWWPLAAYAALLWIVVTSVVWRERRVARWLAAVGAVAVVAVAYEADRLSYYVERTCVRPASGRELCGTLVGQHDRGFYLGVPIGEAEEHAPPQELVFLPADQVEGASSAKLLVRVTSATAENRRERLLWRLGNLRVR